MSFTTKVTKTTKNVALRDLRGEYARHPPWREHTTAPSTNEYVPPSGQVATWAPSASSAARLGASPGCWTSHIWISRSTVWRLVLHAKARLESIAETAVFF